MMSVETQGPQRLHRLDGCAMPAAEGTILSILGIVYDAMRCEANIAEVKPPPFQHALGHCSGSN
jgi:hypothetical protein